MLSDSILEWLVATVLLVFVLAYGVYRMLDIKIIRQAISKKPSIASRISFGDPRVKIIRLILYFIVVVLLVGALIFPPGENILREESSEGVDVLFLVDSSLSMNAVDAKPTRLARFKETLLSLLPELEGNRLGIVVFAGSPFLYCPLTTDMNAFADYVRGLDVDMVGDKGSDINGAFDKAMKLIDSSKLLRNRIIVLASDGEDHSKSSLPRISADLVVWGFGSIDGAPIYYEDGDTGSRGYVTTQGGLVSSASDGQIIISVADPDYLRDIARENRGKYFDLTTDGSARYKLIDDIQDMEKNSLSKNKQLLRNQKPHYFLIPAVFLFFIDISILEWLMFRIHRKEESQ
ncbi:VWA domain-containing protein BatB [Leptospira sp. GIMC2001]|uniref:VWA domain-containing protein BatB n=1 Tax=Leptospira sp. GIMC2001 TaxID=1513297 RepID=UPI00234AECCC|nr:VWA domain-containing protein [Leptospira sp. GIMC2001]WCL47616.1 VWA domain-containing protein [Leptospira sp. GIMC2001]